MKIVEILGGYRIMISEEEKELVNKLEKHGGMNLTELNDRELELADTLLRKNVVNINEYRINFNGLKDLEFVQW